MKYYLGNNLFDGFFGGSEFKQISDLKTDITDMPYLFVKSSVALNLS